MTDLSKTSASIAPALGPSPIQSMKLDAPKAAPAVPTKGSQVEIPGPSFAPDRFVGQGVLTIGKHRFGPGQAGGGELRALAAGITIEEAAKLTANNALDEVFFQTEDGKAYVLFAERASFQGIKPGYFGRFEGKKVKIVAVNDEANTFAEGSRSVWAWLANVGRNAVGNEASRTVTTMVTTAAGSFVAAAAMKGAPAVAATGAASTVAAGGAATAASGGVLGLVSTAGSRAMGAMGQVLNALGGLALAGAMAFAVVSIFAGLKASNKQADATTIDMITGRF